MTKKYDRKKKTLLKEEYLTQKHIREQNSVEEENFLWLSYWNLSFNGQEFKLVPQHLIYFCIATNWACLTRCRRKKKNWEKDALQHKWLF